MRKHKVKAYVRRKYRLECPRCGLILGGETKEHEQGIRPWVNEAELVAAVHQLVSEGMSYRNAYNRVITYGWPEYRWREPIQINRRHFSHPEKPKKPKVVDNVWDWNDKAE